MIVITPNPRADRPAQVPRRPDGAQYRFEMISNGGNDRVYADTITELVEALIPGYDEVATGSDADLQRLLYAVRIQVELQAALYNASPLGSCDEAEREIILAPRDTPPEVGTWTADVPLVLVETYYEPIGMRPRPTGQPRSGGADDSNLIWINPLDELTLIQSLADAGVIVAAEAGK